MISSDKERDMKYCRITEIHERKDYENNCHSCRMIIKTGHKIMVPMFGKEVEVDEVHIWDFCHN